MAIGRRPTWVFPFASLCLLFFLFLIAATVVLALIPLYLSRRNVNLTTTTTTTTSTTTTTTTTSTTTTTTTTSTTTTTTTTSTTNTTITTSTTTTTTTTSTTTTTTTTSTTTTTPIVAIADIEMYSVAYATNETGGRSYTLVGSTCSGNQTVAVNGIPNNTITVQGCYYIPAVASARRKRQTYYLNSTISCSQATGLMGDILIVDFLIKYSNSCVSTCRQALRDNVLNALRLNNQTITRSASYFVFGTQQVQLKFCSFMNAAKPTCVPETQNNIYLVDRTGNLYLFDPKTVTVTLIGSIPCQTNSSVFSMALQRNGLLWIEYLDGHIFFYNIRSGRCALTPFVVGQLGFTLFNMAFVKDTTSNSEALYITKQSEPPYTLGTIDPNTFILSVVNNYSNASVYNDLTGTNDGRLFSIVGFVPYRLAQLNKTTAAILSEFPLDRNYTLPSSHFGLAAYNSQVFFFEGGNNTFTDIIIINPTTNTTTVDRRITQAVYGAASSPCLGTA